MTGKNPVGRPATEEARTERLYIYATPTEAGKIRTAAATDGIPVTAWVRQAALEKANRKKKGKEKSA